MTTQIHDSTTCTAGANGQKCPMCQFAEKAAQRAEHGEIVLLERKNVPEGEYGSGIAISAPDFEQEWNDAPRWATRMTERECAEFWFLRGTIAGELQRTVDDNRMFREMVEQRGLRG